MPFGGAHERLPWGGLEIRGAFVVTGNMAREINVALRGAIRRTFWANLVIHEFRIEKPQEALGLTATHRS